MKKNIQILLLGCFLNIYLAACGQSQVELDALATMMAGEIFATQAAQAPTLTPTSTSTPTPTQTPTADPTTTPTPEPGTFVKSTLNDGWNLYTSQADGFVFALPPEWIQIELSPEAWEFAIVIAGEESPELKGFFTSEMLSSLVATGMKFYGFDPSEEAINLGLPNSINILSVDVGFEIPFDTLITLTLEELKSVAVPDIPITNQRVYLSNVEAEEIKYASELAGLSGDPILVMLTQYLFVEGSVQYVITLGTPLELTDTNLDTFEKIGESFHFIN